MSRRYETRKTQPYELSWYEARNLTYWRDRYQKNLVGGRFDQPTEPVGSNFIPVFGEIISEVLTRFVPQTLRNFDLIMKAQKAAKNAPIDPDLKEALRNYRRYKAEQKRAGRRDPISHVYQWYVQNGII